jgi:hypothetical protein
VSAVAKRSNKPKLETGAASAAPDSDVPFVRERGVYTTQQRKGWELATSAEVEAAGGGIWYVGDCNVNLPRKEGTCKEYRHTSPPTRCPHWWAVAYTIDPPTPDEFIIPVPQQALVVPTTLKLVTATELSEDVVRRVAREDIRGGYSRFADKYDEHLKTEFMETMFFVREFFKQIGPALDTRNHQGRGRKLTPLADLLFAAFLKEHMSGWSLRRSQGMLEFLAHPEIRFISPAFPDFAVVGTFIREPGVTPILRDIMAMLADPLREFGQMEIATDGTGASSNRFDDWRIAGKEHQHKEHRRWYKAHACCDVDTMCIIAMYVTDKNVSEKKMLLNALLPELVAREYDISKFFADGGYNATEIRDEVYDQLKAIPFIPWGKNSKRAISLPWRAKVKHAPMIEAVYAAWKADEGKAFKAEYRYRVKVENLFSSVKGRFGGYVRLHGGNGPENEILLKAICHNVHILLMAAKIYGLDLSRFFESDAAA